MTTGYDVSRLRHKFNLTKKQLAKLIPCSSPAIVGWESGGQITLPYCERLRDIKARLVAGSTYEELLAEVGK